MADNKKSVNFLPEYLRTDKNSKFLSSTLDPLIQTPQIERIDGFVGSKISPNYDPTVDTYINEGSALRRDYSLEPALIFKDNNSKITDVVSYDDLINEIAIQGGKVDNLDKLFRSNVYSYDPYIDWDKLVNYNQYYWLPFGPEKILIDEPIDVDVDIIGQDKYTMENGYSLSNGMKIKFSSNVIPLSYQENEYIVEGVGDRIKLILIELLTSNEKITSIYNETFDGTPLDTYPFDGYSRLPLVPEYVTINRSSNDLNSWSRYNRWFHGEVIRITSEINNLNVEYPLDSRAKRPIVEFKPNIQLYNFGIDGIKNVDHIDTDTPDAFITVDGSAGYYIDGVLISKGDRVIFNADRHPDVRGKIYQVDYDIVDDSITVRLEEVHTSLDLQSVSINYGNINQGTSWHFDALTNFWILSQQHTIINQAPLFDLFDRDGYSCSNNSTFVGSKIFGYDIGVGKADTVLGFPLKYKNSIGVGSYLFKNYFMYDTFDVTENNKSRSVSTSIFYFKINESTPIYANVWQPSVEYQTPVIETTVVSKSTSTIKLTSFDRSVDELSVTTFVNSVLTSSTVNLSTLSVSFASPLKVNDFVSFEIIANYTPNNNGFYKTPLGLTNNPLNGPIALLTLSELSDHLMTMIRNNNKFNGVFPGISNLRDISDYSKYGTRLIINASPISFAHIFLGKKEHNAIDAIRYAGDQYNQFKMNLLRIISEVPGDISPSDALDIVLKEINQDKDYRSSYYRSDMLGYGDNKVIRVKTASTSTREYPIGLDFDLTTSTFKSVLIYVNDEQQVVGKDYNFSIDTIIFTKDLVYSEEISIVYYPDTLGSFVPSTPTKLGLYQAYEPVLTTDYSLLSLTSTNIIIGHDGSIMRAYGDYRDYIILEYEKRIYNNLKVPYNSELFDLNAMVPGNHRNSRYSLDDFTNLITKDFVKWTGLYNIDANTNDLYDIGNPYTWNYNGNIKLDPNDDDKNSSTTFGGSYLSIPPSSVLDFGTGDFTIEAWVYVSTVGTPGIRSIISSVFGSSGLQFGIGVVTGSEVEFIDPNYVVYYSEAGIENSKWHHVALSRKDSLVYVFIDGRSLGGAPKPESLSLCANGYDTLIGAAIDFGDGSVGGAFFGKISNLRVVKGIAVYTETFTPPRFKLTTTQLANQNGYPSAAIPLEYQTSLLTLQDSYIIDNSIHNHQISKVGTIVVDLDTIPFGTKSFSISGEHIRGFWKSIYKYLYDTDRPDTHPWEMLGYSSKPSWWDTYYSWTDLNKRSSLIFAIVNGYTKQPLSMAMDIDLNYARPDFESYIPVDRYGNLLTPSLDSIISDIDKQANWVFGDQAPVETSWRKSSYWPFVLNAAAALLDPCRYTSSMYDVRNTYIETVTGQINYLQNIYLNPKNLLIDGNNNEYASGFGVYIVEKGKEKNKNYISSLKEDISNINFNLFHKFGGFASKDKLQIVVDSIDPVSQAQGAILPLEDYSILLNVSNPIRSASISGVIVQKFGGSFIVKGYNKTNPYFEILTTIKLTSSGSLTVGGKSSSFTEWSSQTSGGLTLASIDTTSAESNTTKYYQQGQIVRYNGRYYTVKAGHTAQSTFDSSLFYLLPELPMKGGSTVQLSSQFSNTVVQVPYGTVYSSIQEVYDMLVGYGAYLEKQGFIFDELNSDLNEIMDWKFTGKEFLYWTTQNWADGHLITLSPFANYLKYSFANSIVDNISTGKYEYSLLKADGKSFPIDKFRLSREDNACTITTINTLEGIFFATLNSIQKEHAMVFNNTTIFNDTIYDIETGYKQQRMKFSGFRTANWNGDLSSPGFVYDQVDITDWKPYTTYLPGVVVRYIGSYYESSVKVINDSTFDFAKWDKLSSMPESNLLPNFDYKISQFEDFYSLDIDNFDSSQQELAQHLVGYTPRNYLNNLFVNPISQYKFYQGYIREKGTQNALSKLDKVGKFTRQGEITLTEDWAFRIGEYGSFSTYKEIEFNLTEGDALENPYVVKLVENIPTNSNPLINYVDTLLITPDDYISSSTFITYPGTFSENNIELTTAGYVRLDDVTATAYNKNSLLDIANNSILQEGHTIWLGFLENGGWTVYRYAKQSAKIAGVYIESPGTSITFSTDINHNLSVGEIISIVNFNTQVNGIYIVTDIPNLDRFTVASTLTSITDDDLLSLGLLFKFEDVRYRNAYQLSNIKDIVKKKYGEKIWIDQGADEKWKVYEKTNNYSKVFDNFETLNFPLGQKLGQAIYSTPDSNLILASAPGLPTRGSPGTGSIWVYTKNPITDEISKQFEYGLSSINATYCDLSYIPNFGFSLYYDDNKNLYFAGAPTASYVRGPASPTGVVTLSTGSGNIRSYMEEGLVKISSKTSFSNKEITEAVLLNPYPETNSNFGYSVYVASTSTTASSILLVSAPGSGNGKVYAYSITATSTISAHSQGITLASHVPLTNKSRFGHKIAGDIKGNIIAISAPDYHNTLTFYTGVVQLFNRNLTWIQTLTSPFGTYHSFGDDVAVSPDGSYIFVSSINTKVTGQPYGKVAVYKFNGTTATLHQIISNPVRYNNLKFGVAISISEDNSTLAISALGINSSNKTRFDFSSKNGETIFDGKTTRFNDAVDDSGVAYVFENLEGYFVPVDELTDYSIPNASKFGTSIAVTNLRILVGSPSLAVVGYDASTVYQFDKIDTSIAGWKLSSKQADLVDVSNISRVVLIDNFKEEVIEYLDVIDPLKGKIAGIAEQELKYKSAFDPAIYSIGLAGSIVDSSSSWIDEHVGELWWDLSNTKYVWYEQGDDIFRKNNWGKLFPGSSIDVYEWVKSDLLPAEWAARADTTSGLTKGISGQPKYPDNSNVSVKQLFNNVTLSFENVYYFWVKNKVTVPNSKNRRISSYQVSRIIADPSANGLKFVEILSSDSVAFANVQPLLVGSRINANIAIDNTKNNIPKHTEWVLLSEGDYHNSIHPLLEKKLFDSLVGYDLLGNSVPDTQLTYRNRYGIGIRPQQTLFKDKSAALKNLIEFANSVLIKNRIVGNYSFDNLLKKDPIPDIYSKEYDLKVETSTDIDNIDTRLFERATLSCTVNNGKITGVSIINPGFGYINSPSVTVVGDETGAAIVLTINTNGSVISASIENYGSGFTSSPQLLVRPHTVIVSHNELYQGRWTKHVFNYNSSYDLNWTRIKNQTYDTSLYWNYVNWVSEDYIPFKDYNFVVAQPIDITSLNDVQVGDYVKVNNIGNGNFAILKKIASDKIGNFSLEYDIIFKENGTIKISDLLWNYSTLHFLYDTSTIDETLYDQIPDKEIFYILTALRDDIFINELKVQWNRFFFAAVKYALIEQKLLDWAFKTSFINVTNLMGELDQRPVYKLDNEKYFEEYVKEVKPYHSNIRNYISKYTYIDDTVNFYSTDFDLPPYYNQLTSSFDVVNTLTNTLLNQEPWKSWKDNYQSSIGSIIIADAGSGYAEQPTVSITGGGEYVTKTATAIAYIRNSSVYKIVVTDPGAGYTTMPSVTIEGGGFSVSRVASASAILSNLTIRKNTIGIKFNRINSQSEIGDINVRDTFICSGQDNSFVLSWLADTNKLNIIPSLDGKLILSTEYTIEYYKETYNGYSKQYSKFVFLDLVPNKFQFFTISYKKSIELYTAADMIKNLYTGIDAISELMTGTVYPAKVVQGLPFNYSPTYGYGKYDDAGSVWSNIVDEYASAKIISNVNVGDIILYLNTVTNIVPGQVINVLNSPDKKVRNDTIVTHVNTVTKSITISQPIFSIRSYQTTSTNSGTSMVIKTREEFNGSIVAGDSVYIPFSDAGGPWYSVTGSDYPGTAGDSWSNFMNSYAIWHKGNFDVNTFYCEATVNFQVTGDYTFNLSADNSAKVTIDPGSLNTAVVGDLYNVDNTVDTTNYTGDPASSVTVSVNSGPHIILIQVTNYGGPAGVALQIKDVDNNEIWNTRLGVISVPTPAEIGGRFIVDSVIDVDKFVISANKILTTTTQYFNRLKNVSVDTIIKPITVSTVLLDYINGTFIPLFNFNTIVINLGIPFDNITNSLIYKSGIIISSVPTNAEYYILSKNESNGNTILNFFNMVADTYELDISIYGDPVIEFWKTDKKVLSTTATITSNFTSTFTSTDSYIYHDGDVFLNERSGYAPEELVAGTVLDSVGINVYTKADKSYATAFSGSFMIQAGITGTSVTLNLLENDLAIMMVHFNSNVFTRVANETELTTSSQYYMIGYDIYIPPQAESGILGYTAMSIGGDYSVLDKNIITVNNDSTSTVKVDSLAIINDVHQAYVLLDGMEVSEAGYSLTAVSGSNKRACVNVFNVPTGTHNIEAWFFESKYTKFNRIHEEVVYSTVTNDTFSLSVAPGIAEPVSSQIIVTIDGVRLTPPWVSYYKVTNNQRVFPIESKNTYDPNVFNSDNTFVYINGVELRLNYEYTVNSGDATVIIVNGLLRNGDAVAIMSLYVDNIYGRPNHEYLIDGNTLKLVTPVIAYTKITVLTFTDHDNVMVRTENFDGNPYRRFTLDLPIRNDNYLWVYVNGKQLTSRYDFEILENSKTIQISDLIDITDEDTVTITTLNPSSYGTQILGFRMFKDMFGRDDYKRLSEFYSTSLTSELNYDSTEIEVKDSSRLISPNPLINKPGVVLIDGERIEYFRKDGNVLKELRRGTLGTGRPVISAVGTKVIDQSQSQVLPDLTELTLIQTTSTNTTTYIINTMTNSITGDGITFIDGVDLVDQVSVYYGGRHLRKSSLAYHDKNIAYDPTDNSVSILPPEFTINSTTGELVLNVADTNGINTTIEIVQRKGQIWTGTNGISLISSTATQAVFMRDKVAILPDIHYYGG